MSLVVGRSVEFGSKLFMGVVSIIHPNLIEVRAMRRQIAHGLAGLLDGCDDIRHIVSRRIVRPGSRPRQPTPDRAKQRRSRMDFFTQLIRQLAEIGSHTDGGGESVIRVSLEMIEEILAIEIRFRHASVQLVEKSEMAMDINQRRNDSLTG